VSSWISPENKIENADYAFHLCIVKQGGNYPHFMENEAVNTNCSQCETEMLGMN